MSIAAGERFHLDLDIDGENNNAAPQAQRVPAFISDIKERDSARSAPAAPSLKNNTGFPAHKKRPRVSAFKQQRNAQAETPSLSSGGTNATKTAAAAAPNLKSSEDQHLSSFEQAEKRRIDEENRQVLADMSPEEIERERQELLSSLNPALIQKLLSRSTIDDDTNHRAFDSDVDKKAEPRHEPTKAVEPARVAKKVSFAALNEPSLERTGSESVEPSPRAVRNIVDEKPTGTHVGEADDATHSVHFPRPPQPPDLDPSAPDFLENLHSKYFPSTPYDPSSLDWMAPTSNDDTASPYHPGRASLEPGELRFGFNGALIPPRTAQSIPVTKGLHHHGDAPEAAGYTIPELARLARSAVASQRCIAYQILGRLLFRLGRGEFGIEDAGAQQVDIDEALTGQPSAHKEDDDLASSGALLARGLWDTMDGCRVLETIMEEANKDHGHLSARTYAQEALWNWRRGGGRKRTAT